jgi:hypothetical protein
LRPPSNADLPFVIEAAAQSAWSTDRGSPIVSDVIAALRAAKIILPAPVVIERTAMRGGPEPASGPRMPCSRASPRRSSPSSMHCSSPIGPSRRLRSPGCGMPRPRQSRTIAGATRPAPSGPRDWHAAQCCWADP